MTPAAGGRTLWLRWSWRDLRGHWVAVLAIATVLAIGTGVFAGLGSTSTWRRVSNDASFAALAMHDLRVELSPGTFTDEGALLGAVATLPPGAVDAAAERLIVDTQVDASTNDEAVLVVGRIVGTPLAGGVDEVWIETGRPPSGPSEAVLEMKFAENRDLEVGRTVTVAGGDELVVTGLGVAPEDFFYEGPEGSLFSEGEMAIVYVPLATAQDLAGRPGAVNDLVLTLTAGADRQAVAAQLERTVADLGVSASVTTTDDAYAWSVLYEDIDNDQRFWNAIALLVLFAAALAAFNLISRIVEAQRREIGIGMALGVPRRWLAVRPLLVGIQVGVLGTVAGIGIGLLVGAAMADLLASFLPLPEYRTPFQAGIFARAAALGLLVPLAAAAIPTWRAVRVEPIEAIRTGHLTARTSRITDWTGRVRLPGSTTTLMPLRNVLRTPRRTVLTAVGVGVAITALVTVLGLLDSVTTSIDRGGEELTRGDRDRVLVTLDTFHPADGPVVGAVSAAPSVGRTDAALRLPATALGEEPDDDVELLVELLDLDAAAWTPTVRDGTADPASGLLLAAKAADDLGVGPGDIVTVRHPARGGDGSFALVESELVVSGIHGNPLRTFAFLDLAHADRFGLAGDANLVHAHPAAGAAADDVQRDVFGLDGVASSQAVARISEGFDEALGQFAGILFIAGAFVLVLALLIAFNSTRITVEERRREHATMRAYGLPTRTVMGMVVRESLLVGVAATLIGLLTGTVLLGYMLSSLAETTLPDLGIELVLSPATLLATLAVGIVAVAVAPLFLLRRVAGMDIPSTLRVME